MKHKKRSIDLSIISDVHLGTYGCHARELLKYLKSIKPTILILNGDIIDMWQFKKRYWPKPHMKVLKYIIGMATKGVKVYYITGNHDEMLRKFSGLQLGNIELVDKLELELDGKKAWIFHGDVFDVIMQYSKWLAKLGSIGYDALILLNVVVNKIGEVFGRKKVSISKKVKDNVKSALKYVGDFEDSAAKLAIKKGYDYIICGHIHKPSMRTIKDEQNNTIEYLNSGDWIENLSALEYSKGTWNIYYFLDDMNISTNGHDPDEKAVELEDLNNKELFQRMLNEFQK